MVVGKDVKRNRLILGYEDASTQGLYAAHAVVGGISNMLAPLPSRVMAQPRYRAKGGMGLLRISGRREGAPEL